MRRRINVMLATLMFAIPVMASTPMNALAAPDISVYTNGPEARWNYLTVIQGSLDINDGIAHINTRAAADGSGVNKMKVTVDLQRISSNGSVKTIKTWTTTKSSFIASLTKDWAVDENYLYQIVITADAYIDGSLVETASHTVEQS